MPQEASNMSPQKTKLETADLRKAWGALGEDLVDRWSGQMGWQATVKNACWKGGEVDRVYRRGQIFCATEVKTHLVWNQSQLREFQFEHWLKVCLKKQQLQRLWHFVLRSQNAFHAKIRVVRVFLLMGASVQNISGCEDFWVGTVLCKLDFRKLDGKMGHAILVMLRPEFAAFNENLRMDQIRDS
jgi:Holliday junction resolvase-like predicted endonuclease